MSAHRGIITGTTPMDRAVKLAGALAELGLTRLVLHVNGAEVDVAARVTNLPGVLVEEVARRGEAKVAAPAIGAEFSLSADGGAWECADTHAAGQLKGKLQV